MAEFTQHARPPFDVRLADRRRSGRVDYQDGHLIALLRDQPLIIDPIRAQFDETFPSVLPGDPGEDAAQGTAIGTIIGASMWVGAIFAIWHLI